MEHIPIFLFLLRPSKATIGKNLGIDIEGKGYRIDTDRALRSMKRCWYQAAIRAKRKRLCAIILGIKTAVRENATIFMDLSNCAPLTALRGFCHAQHIRNMHATWRVARPRNVVFYSFWRSGLFAGRKKVELHLKDWLSRKMRGRSAKHRKLQRCVAAQHAMLRGCCVCVADDKTHATLQIVDKPVPDSKLPAKRPENCEFHRQPKTVWRKAFETLTTYFERCKTSKRLQAPRIAQLPTDRQTFKLQIQ